MCPEIFLYSSLLFALSTNSLIRFGNKDFFAPLTVFQAHLYMTITDAII